LRKLPVILFFLTTQFCCGQNLPTVADTLIPFTKGFDRNPVSLAKKLTAGKEGDREKFDALFTWVAKNIHYNYSSYYSSNGAGKTNFKKMLRYKAGICLDYACLMDTLCKLSGIENTTIYGYVKDEIFDVADSIYVDNHAWNAVKLDGKWYVYDVTFATGEMDYGFTKFSQWIIKTAKRFPVDYKKKKVRKKNSYVFVDDCGVEERSPAYYYKEKKFNRFMRWALHFFRLKIKVYYTKKANYDYYLVEPKLFSVTHHPDQPAWSLLEYSKVRQFECDSSFYYHDDSLYKDQNRHGSVCPECDSYLAQSELNKNHILRKESYAFNNRNPFILSLCEYNIGNINHFESLDKEDSLIKVGFLDTAISYLDRSRKNYQRCLKKLEEDFILQKDKNKRKQMHLLADNRQHTAFIKTNISKGLMFKRRITSIVTRGPIVLKQFKRKGRKSRTLKIPIKMPEGKKLPQKEVEELEKALFFHQFKIDSLSAVIQNTKDSIEREAKGLSVNFWNRIVNHDSLIIPIRRSTDLRYKIKDDFKKSIVDVRRQIPIYEKVYDNAMNNVVYDPVEALWDKVNRLMSTMARQTVYEFECYRIKSVLAKFNLLPTTDLNAIKIGLSEKSKEDYCWLKGVQPLFKSTISGFVSLRTRQREAMKTIVKENDTERFRTSYTSHELLRRKKKYKHIVIGNSRLVNSKLSKVKKDKRDYLNMLKRERRKAGKKVR
jgi:hypothetical protein